jgi:ATP-binding cassette subfamily B protein
MSPSENTRPMNSSGKGHIRRIVTLFRPYRFTVTMVGLLILVTSSLGVVNPLLIKVVFDSGLFPESGVPNIGLLWWVVAVMAAIALASGGLGVLQTYWSNKVGQNVMRDLRDTVYEHLQGLSLRFFTNTKTGEIQSRLSNDVGGIQTVVTTTLSDTVANCVIFASTLIAMLILSWQLTLVAVAITPVFFVLTRYVGVRRRAVTAETQKSMAEITTITQETLSVSGIMLAKLFGTQRQEADNFHHHNQRLADLVVRRQMIGHSFFAVVMTFMNISPAFIYLLAGYLIQGGGSLAASAGTVIAFTTLQSRLYFPIGRLLEVSVELQSSMALFDRIFGYLDLKQEIVDAPNALTLQPENVSGAVRFQGVRVNYGETAEELLDRTSDDGAPGSLTVGGFATESWALDGIDLEIPAGKMAAFVGPSGAGKTTIAYLIPRLYDATEGTVSIDGTDVRQVSIASLSRLVGYVTQESYLFHASLRQNMLYGKPEASQEEIEAAAVAAHIHGRIMEFPEKYDTIVGERGFRLSGGERQRLAIARMILHQPRILILDEATSALDTASERYVQAALEPLMKGRTTLVIAHRLSTILSADIIYVVDQGKIVEQGSHTELLGQRGLYSQLYLEQFGAGRIECHCQDGMVLSDGTVVSGIPMAAPSLVAAGAPAPAGVESPVMPWREDAGTVNPEPPI